MKKYSVSVVIPAYNEEGNISILMELMQKTFEANCLDAEVILVNDGSTDNTLKEAMECMERYSFLRVFSHLKNEGMTEALETGFQHMTKEVVAIYPADLQYLPEDIPVLLEKLDEGYDMVTGWRQGTAYKRRFVSALYNLISKLLFRVRIHDQNSIKVFKADILKELPLRSEWHRYLVSLAAHAGYRISEAKVNVYPRKYGKSKYGMGRVLVGVLDLFAVACILLFQKKPMLLFGTTGICFFVTGFLIECCFIVADIFLSIPVLVELPVILFGILLILTGIGLFSLGLLGEMIMNVLQRIEKR